MSRLLLPFLLLAGLSPALIAQPAEAPSAAAPGFSGEAWSRVDVAPTKTSIYIGTVRMTMQTFVRAGDAFTTTYVAKVFPFAFYNEHGTLSVTVTDAQLAELERGQTIEFTGEARNSDGETRRVTGKATPSNASSGKLKVRVWVSKRIELIFNTTYERGARRQG